MTDFLQQIIAQKEREVAFLHKCIGEQPNHPIISILHGNKKRGSSKSFKATLQNAANAVIAEIKRKSPSKGLIKIIEDPSVLAKQYVDGGASAISVLTDEVYFGGKIADLTHVALSLKTKSTPILRKDFIIHPIQIAESILHGADAILCIVAVSGDKTKQIIREANLLGIDTLVEVHNENELDIALTSGAEIIGVNNRNLKTLAVNPAHALTLIEKIPKEMITIAESGMNDPMIAQDYFRAGFNAVLIGEALVKAKDPGVFIRECRYV